jgi:hypothetical protein
MFRFLSLVFFITLNGQNLMAEETKSKTDSTPNRNLASTVEVIAEDAVGNAATKIVSFKATSSAGTVRTCFVSFIALNDGRGGSSTTMECF